MNQLILATATRYLLPLLLLLSFFILLRGHNAPGGGFIGGLIAAAAFALYAIGYGVRAARRLVGVNTRTLIGFGLSLSLTAALIPLLGQQPFMKGLWFEDPLPFIGKFGTPVLFDLGVYLVVLGVVLTVILSLAEEVPATTPVNMNDSEKEPIPVVEETVEELTEEPVEEPVDELLDELVDDDAHDQSEEGDERA